MSTYGSQFRQASLLVTLGETTVTKLTLQLGKKYVIGRHGSSNVALDDGHVSRRHAALELRADGVYLTDLKSGHGVWVDGKRIQPETPVLLFPMQVIQICDYVLTVRLHGFPDAPEEDDEGQVQRLVEAFPDIHVLGPLGKGSTGTVWAAVDRSRQRRVALKLLHATTDPDSDIGRRFLQEAEVCMRVMSDNVVAVYDVRFMDGQPVIVMELVNGPSARERLEACDHDLPLVEALKIGEDVARGLAAVQEAGVVHRDVKPSNILLGPAGAKLTDFGIAKNLASPGLTETGLGLGTLGFVAPEQIVSARSVDWRADIYGLGATLYNLITGRPAFNPNMTVPALFKMITEQAPTPIESWRPECPPDLAGLVLEMMHKELEARPQSHLELSDRFRAFRLAIQADPSLHETQG